MAGKTHYLANKVLNHCMRNTAYAAPATVYVALFTAAPDDDYTEAIPTGTEVPAANGYARKAVTFGAPTSGAMTNSAAVEYDESTAAWAAGANITHFAIMEELTGGEMQMWGRLQGPNKVFTADETTDTLTSTGHGYSNGQLVFVTNENGALPAGLSAATDYYIIGVTANTFQLSLTSGGAAVNITDKGSGTHKVALNKRRAVTSDGVILRFAAGELSITED